jgi:ComF family protein
VELAKIAAAARAFADLVFPRFCIICSARVEPDNAMDLCAKCDAQVARTPGRWCPKCAAEMPQYGDACPNCHNMSLAMKGSTAFGVYSGTLRERILSYKFSGRRDYSRTFGLAVARAVRKAWPDVGFDGVIGVPLHPERRRERGFDQARHLATYVARALATNDRPKALRRVRATQSQVGLTKSARGENMRGAFAAGRCDGLQTVLLVDDIMTTGATASEAARTLKRAGIKRVFAGVIARADFREIDRESFGAPDVEG